MKPRVKQPVTLTAKVQVPVAAELKIDEARLIASISGTLVEALFAKMQSHFDGQLNVIMDHVHSEMVSRFRALLARIDVKDVLDRTVKLKVDKIAEAYVEALDIGGRDLKTAVLERLKRAERTDKE